MSALRCCWLELWPTPVGPQERCWKSSMWRSRTGELTTAAMWKEIEKSMKSNVISRKPARRWKRWLAVVLAWSQWRSLSPQPQSVYWAMVCLGHRFQGLPNPVFDHACSWNSPACLGGRSQEAEREHHWYCSHLVGSPQRGRVCNKYDRWLTIFRPVTCCFLHNAGQWKRRQDLGEVGCGAV